MEGRGGAARKEGGRRRGGNEKRENGVNVKNVSGETRRQR